MAETATPAARTLHAVVPTVLGEVTLVASRDPEPGEDSGDGAAPRPAYGPAPRTLLTGLYFAEHQRRPEPEELGARVDASRVPVLALAAAELAEYLAGERQEFDVPLAPRGDDFSERVWAMLRGIPYGETTTYGELADRLGSRGLAQRVGQAVGRNPICVLIPCHRVVGSDGALTGYAGGLERKQFLLELEEPAEAAASRLF